MSPSKPRKPPRKRNLAAKALRSPLFKPRIEANPNAYRRRKRFTRDPVDEGSDDQIN